MPHIYVKNMTVPEVSQLSLKTTPLLATAIACPPDWLVFHQSENSSFVCGEPCTQLMVIVDVFWFKRAQAVQDQVATILTEQIKMLHGRDSAEVTIVFHPLENDGYYEDGKHF